MRARLLRTKRHVIENPPFVNKAARYRSGQSMLISSLAILTAKIVSSDHSHQPRVCSDKKGHHFCCRVPMCWVHAKHLKSKDSNDEYKSDYKNKANDGAYVACAQGSFKELV